MTGKVLALFAALLAGAATTAVAPGQDARSPLLFRASFDRGWTADVARGSPEPLNAERLSSQTGRLGKALHIAAEGQITYDAVGNLRAEAGTVSFWWKPDGPPGRLSFPLFSASYEQHSTWDFNFLRVEWNGRQFAARVRDRNLVFSSLTVPQEYTGDLSRWRHMALSWDELDGLRFYLDGRPVAAAPGPLHLKARLDQFGLLARAVTPHHTSGTENAGSLDEVRIYDRALPSAAIRELAEGREPADAGPAFEPPAAHLAGRYGWADCESRSPTSLGKDCGIPDAVAGAALHVRKVAVLEGRDIVAPDKGKFWLKGADGKRETTWPMVGHGYTEEGKRYRLKLPAEPWNYLRITGNLVGKIFAGSDLLFERTAQTGELSYFSLSNPREITELIVERESGVLGDVEALEIKRERVPPNAAAPAALTIRGQGPEIAFPPAATDLPVDAVRLRAITGAARSFLTVAVHDPVNESRDLLNFEARVAGAADLLLDFPDIILPAGQSLKLSLIDSGAPSLRSAVEAQVILSTPEKARREHLAQRLVQIRDSFQMLSEARPWMLIGRSGNPSREEQRLRRRLKLVDELLALLEDVRRIEPQHEITSAYWGWIHRWEAPPPLEIAAATPPPASGIPLWAYQQTILLRQFRQVTDWWIRNRQIPSGEMGGGLGDDTDMVQNWPGVALLDGPAPEIARSVRAVVEACYAQGMVERGLNARRMDALHAYEEGMNALAPAFLLDFGNPILFERMMETAAHYARLTGVNAAGHRHFRSYQYGTNDLVEEGYHAREDIYSHLIFHPGLYVAWYNGHPGTKSLLVEFGRSLLAHWQRETYPQLARGIYFPTDEVLNRATPNNETWNLLWGLFELTGDREFLWLLEQAVKAGDFGRAQAVNGPWLRLFRDALPAMEKDSRGRAIHDHNLQTDQVGLVARALAWQARGDKALLEDAQAALVRHMAQNLDLYTEAEQFTDRIWIPTLAVQRARLGGVAHFRNAIFPGHAVSWENTGGEVAALVPEARPDYLRAEVFHTGTSERKVIMRVWGLENGAYSVSDGNGTRTMKLKRYAPVALTLPPRRAVTVTIRQQARGTPFEQLPDLAVAPEDLRYDAATDTLEVVVHNIGGAPAAPFAVEVAGQRLSGPRLEAPLDLKPKTATLRFPGLRQRGLTRAEVVLNPDERYEEITDANNRASVKF